VGGPTTAQFSASAAGGRQCGHRLAYPNRVGFRWFAAAALVLLSACDGASGWSSRLSSLADPVQTATFPDLSSMTAGSERGRAVATMSAKSAIPDPGPEIVVRRRESPGPDIGGRASGIAPASGKPGDVTLNFAGADIRDVVASVLGDMLKLNYVIDPEVTGPITFNVSRPLSRDDVLPTFETILNSRGATMTQANGIVRVMPLRKELVASAGSGVIPASAASGSTPGAPRAPALAAGERSAAFTLRYVSAADMQKLLEKVLPPGTAIVIDESRRMLVVQGGPAELRLAQETVRIFDIDQLSGMSMALVPLRNADPTMVSDELKNIFAATRKEADGEALRFMAIDRLNAIMVLSRSDRYLDEARAWVARLDRSRNLNEKRVYVYNLRHSKAAQIGQKLQGLLSSLDIQFKAPAGSTGDGLGSDKEGGAKPEGKKPGGAEAIPVSMSSPRPPPPDAPRGAGGERAVRVEADEARNALLISASPRDYELIRQVLDGIDVPPLQVLIEVTVAEVVLNDKLNYGVQYFITSGEVNTLLTNKSSLPISPTLPGFALSWVSGKFNPKAILDLLSEVSSTKVISTPRLLVLSNQTARLQVGDVVPIITQSATSTVTSNPSIVNNVTYKETGVVLEVTPRVNDGGNVTMDVAQAVSDVVNTTTSTIDSPTIRQRRLNSTISVRSGETIVLGGLIQQRDSRSSSGIPVLAEIPAIGALFGTHGYGAGRTELIMLMTPRVIANDEQARAVTSTIEQQFRSVLDGTTMVPPRLPPPR